MNMKLIRPLLIGLLCFFGTANLAAKPETIDDGNYTTKDSEFYLTPEQLLFIRPGLVLEIVDVVIPADRQTEVTFTLTDPAGLPLDRTGVFTPGPVSTSFVLSFIPSFEESYVAYTTRVQTSPITGDSAVQASTDSGGTYAELSIGTYRYKFGTVLPVGYDIDATHTLGVYAVRNLSEFELGTYVANELDHFVPSGSSEPMPRDIVTTETCNGRCHDPLAIHGGSRREVGLCILCHNARQDIDPDTGNSIDMPLMIHKIHMGENLSEDYTIIGYRQSVHNYNDVVYPAPVNECTDCHTGGIPTENFPMVSNPSAALVCDSTGHGSVVLNWEYTDSVEIRVRTASNPDGKLFATGGPSGSAETGKWVADGTTFDIYDTNTQKLLQSVPVNATVLGCISNAPGTFRGDAGAQHTNWMDHPSRKTCGSCHDDINWETGEGHSESNLVMADDITCDNCHLPYTGNEFDRSVRGAHLELYKSAQFPGVLIKLMSVTNTNPGDNPTITFSVGSKNAPIDPATLDRLRFMLSGPNDDYSFQAQESAINAAVWVGGNTWAYTFARPLPEDAEGSFTVSVEGRNIIPIDFDPLVEEERDNAENPLLAFAITDVVATPRRMVVDDYNCESCHSNLAFHGGNRHDPQYCNTCHMPESLDFDGDQTIHFKYMIHSIHRGEELEYGFSIGNHDYSDVVYPGDLRNCDSCHVNNSQQVPVDSGLLSTLTPQAWWSPMMPNTAACLSCHDDDDAAAHAYANTAFFGESCGTCHGEGRVASVDKVHAQ
ncbi:MAG: OmcA/MtrC family decaheme c-type cytochrome [Lysobacterales bacterium]